MVKMNDAATGTELDLKTNELKKAASILRALNHKLRQEMVR